MSKTGLRERGLNDARIGAAWMSTAEEELCVMGVLSTGDNGRQGHSIIYTVTIYASLLYSA